MPLFKTGELKTTTKTIMSMALPVTGTQLAIMALNVTDVVMAGRLSAVDLAAVSVGVSYYLPGYIFVMGIMMAVNPIVGHLVGSGDTSQVGEKYRQGLWVSAAFIIPFIFFLRNSEWAMTLMSIEPAVGERASGYLRALSLGTPLGMLFIYHRFFNDGIAYVKPALIVLLCSIPLNIFFNYTFMYGKFGFPQMGAVGTGYATSVVVSLSLIMLALWMFKTLNHRYQLLRWSWPKWQHMREFLSIGVPNGLSIGMEVSLFAIIALFVGSFGAVQVGAHQVAINIASITFMIPLGISIVLTILIGQAMGRQDGQAIRRFGVAGLGLSTLFEVLSAVVMFLFPEFLMGLYSDDPAVIDLGSKLLRYAALFQIADGFQVTGIGILRGLKDTKVPMWSNVVSYWLIGLPTGYYFGKVREMGPEGFWLGLVGGLTVAAILHNWRFYRLQKRL